MVSEAELIISFIFKRSGKTKLSPAELYLPLSMDLKWFTPTQAKNFVNNAIKQKLLIKKGGLLKPSFDYSKIYVPLNYFPQKQIRFERSEKIDLDKQVEMPILEKILKKLSEEVDISKKDILAKVKDMAEKKNISDEVAALILSKKYNVEYNNFLDDVEKEIFKESKE